MRIIGVDFGEKKIGLAVATGRVALSFGVVANDQQLFPELKKICREEEIEAVVVGLPLNWDGTEGEMAQKVKSFSQDLERHLGLKVSFGDERLTTQEAKQRLKKKKVEDGGAAALMLQSYLDRKS